jgi:GAF domain-containing protein
MIASPTKALRLRDSPTSIRAALAVPMANRGELFGFVPLGARPDGPPYRMDQIETLEYATRELGLDLCALQLERLAEEAAAERRTSETLRAQLQTVMELARRGPQEG